MSVSVRAAGWTAFALFVVILIWSPDVVFTVFTAVLLAVFFRSLSDWLARKTGLGDGWSLVIVLAGLCVLIGGVSWLIAPSVAEQIDELARSLPGSARRLTERLSDYDWGRRVVGRIPSVDQMITGPLLARMGGIFSSALGWLSTMLIVLILAIYLAAGSKQYREGAILLVPPESRARAREVLHAVGLTLRAWIIGQLVAMLVIAICAVAGFSLLGIPLALALGVLTGLLNIVPYLGSILAFLPVFIVAFAHDPISGLWVSIFLLALQNLEGNLLTPMIQRQAVNLQPALLIVAQLLMGVLFGFYGILVAAPLVAMTAVLVKKLYLEGTLGEPANV